MAESHILLFVPWIEGGDLMNLQYVVEGLLKINHRLTLAIDMRTDEVREILQRKSPTLLAETKQVNAYGSDGKFRGGSEVQALRETYIESGANTAFVNMVDTFMSGMLRRAALGINPPIE